MPQNAPNPAEPASKQGQAHLPKETSSAERARILLALIDKQSARDSLGTLPEEAENLQGPNPSTSDTLPSQETLLSSARDLLARLEKKPAVAPSPRAVKPNAPLSKSVIRSTIAALIESSDLSTEHPAIIAIVLQKQSAKTKAAALRQLPGPTARWVQRCIQRLDEMP